MACWKSAVARNVAGNWISGRYRGLTWSWSSWRATCRSRAHSRVSACELANAASAVPKLPAPSTATRIEWGAALMRRSPLLACHAGRQDKASIAFLVLLFRQLGDTLFVQTLEVDFGQMQGR